MPPITQSSPPVPAPGVVTPAPGVAAPALGVAAPARGAGLARELLADLAALLWPSDCLGCGRPDRRLCGACARTAEPAPPRCSELGELATAAGDPGARAAGLGVPCFVAAAYERPVSAMLVAYKHGGAFGFSRPLGRLLALPLRRACEQQRNGSAPPLLVPLPSRRAHTRERGFRHVDELVRVAARTAGLPLRPRRALRATAGRAAQLGLGASGRERNARRIAVTRRAGVRGREVVLVDDIVTTGASCRAAIAAIEGAGGAVIAVAAVCAAVRRDTRGKGMVEARR